MAINYGDPQATISKYIKENHWAFVIARGVDSAGKPSPVFEQYGVQAYPTLYVIDPSGKVAWRSVGYDDAAVRAALKKLGVE